MPPFPFKTRPFPKQIEVLRTHALRPYYALLWEQRCGKSKAFLDDAALGALRREIDAVIITAPSGVHTNWIRHEVPRHWTDAVPHGVWRWSSDEARVNREAYTERFKAWVAEPGVRIFAHNIESINTPFGAAVVKYLLTHRTVQWGIDEADDLTDPTSSRATLILKLARFAAKRRVLSGTLGAGGPFAYYAPMAFLTPDFWLQHGMRLTNVTRFKQYFARFREITVAGRDGRERGVFVLDREANGRKAYRNFDTFRKLVDPHVHRVLQSEMYPHLAALQVPHVTTHYFALSDAQRALARQVKRDYVTKAPVSGRVVDASMATTRLMRLHQIACGYLGVEADEPAEIIPGPQPRIAALLRAVQSIGADEKVVVWTAFRLDQALVCDALRAAGYSVGRFDGIVTERQRDADKVAFLDAEHPRVLVANMQAMSRGHDLSRANHEVFYSYPHRLLFFLQARERLKGPNQIRPIFRHWIIAEGTVDEQIRRAYELEQEISDLLTGDPRRDLGLSEVAGAA